MEKAPKAYIRARTESLMKLRNLKIHTQNNKQDPYLSSHKNQIKVHQRPKHETPKP